MSNCQIVCKIPFYQKIEEKETRCSSVIRLTSIAIGIISTLVAILIFSKIPSLSHLGTSGGAGFLGAAGFIFLTGILIRCVKKEGSGQKLTFEEYSQSIFARYDALILEMKKADPQFFVDLESTGHSARFKKGEVTKIILPYGNPQVWKWHNFEEYFVHKTYGNCASIQEADVVILADSNHADEDLQWKIDSIVGSYAKKGDAYLQEGAPANHHLQAQERHWSTNRDIMMIGWDAKDRHEQIYPNLLTLGVKLSGGECAYSFSFTQKIKWGIIIENLISDLEKLNPKRISIRNASLDQTIQKHINLLKKGNKVFVHAGSAHVIEEELIERLKGIKYFVIFPKEGAPISDEKIGTYYSFE